MPGTEGQAIQPQNPMKSPLRSVLQLSACIIAASVFSAHAQTAKVDPTGTWTWTTEGRNGQMRTNTLKLKLEGEKLTGTMVGRRQDVEIKEAKIKDGEITFKVTREFQSNSFTMQYAAKITGDVMKGKITSERGGETQTREFEAKRAKKTN